MITLSFAFGFHTSAMTQFSMMISRTTVTQFLLMIFGLAVVVTQFWPIGFLI